MTVQKTRIPFVYLIFLALSACANLPNTDLLSGSSQNYAANSTLSGYLRGADKQALEGAFIKAMEGGAVQSWRGSKASGTVRPAGHSVANLLSNPSARLALAEPGLNFSVIVETELGQYVLTRNSNIRRGPNNKARVVEVLPSGSGVEVVGKVTNANWMLIAVDGVVRGYVFGNLLIKAPGTELELAGGPRRKPLLCREFSQSLRVRVGAAEDRWRGVACNDGTGWRLTNTALAPEPLYDDELLGR